MGVGQQLNVSADPFTRPLDELGDLRPAVVGFDLEELAVTQTYQFPTTDRAIDQLLTLADQGAILTASWHATNPHTKGSYTDRSWTNLKKLLKSSSREARAFWADYDEKLELLARFQNGDEGRHRWTPIVFRPLHEANGGFFWWGKPNPTVYKKLYARLQERAWDAGVHNLVWAYSYNRRTSGVMDPVRLLPDRVDLGGLDSYDPERGRERADRLWLEGYAAVTSKKSVPRSALTEVGPHGSRDGSWNPAVITKTVRAKGLTPAWAMLWFDDGNGRDGVTGRKQLGSLDGGIAWLRECPGGLCDLR